MLHVEGVHNSLVLNLHIVTDSLVLLDLSLDLQVS